MPTLNKKESIRFVKKMIATENRKPTKQEKAIAKEISSKEFQNMEELK